MGYEHVSAALRRGRRFLVVVWHGKGLLPIFFFQGQPLVVYTSEPRDQTLPSVSRNMRRLTLAALHHLGYQVLDASAFRSESRGVLRFLHMLEEERGGVIAADGPKGPVFHAHPGAVYVAKKSGVALLPVGAAMRDALVLDSWDRFEIPRPFTRAVLAVGPLLEVPESADETTLALLSQQLEDGLNALTTRARTTVRA